MRWSALNVTVINVMLMENWIDKQRNLKYSKLVRRKSRGHVQCANQRWDWMVQFGWGNWILLISWAECSRIWRVISLTSRLLIKFKGNCKELNYRKIWNYIHIPIISIRWLLYWNVQIWARKKFSIDWRNIFSSGFESLGYLV